MFLFFNEVFANQDTLYFDKYYNISWKDEAEIYRVYERSGDLFLIKDFYNTGKIKLKTYSNSYNSQIKQGATTHYYEDGLIESSGNYSENVKEGNWVFYYKNGNVKELGEFSAGARKGIWKEFFDNEQLESEGNYNEGVKVGNWYYYYDNGQVREFGQYNNKGRHIGEWTGSHKNGEKEYHEFYNNEGGLENTASYWYDNGQLLVQKEYIDDKVVKGGTSYHKNGKINVVFSYNKEGEKIGGWQQYYDNGNIRIKGEYKKSVKDGLWKEFYPNQVTKNMGVYKKDEKNGEWKYFYKNGKESAIIKFKNNQILEERYYNIEGEEEKKENHFITPKINSESGLEQFVNLNLNIPNDSVSEGNCLIALMVSEKGLIEDVSCVGSISSFIDTMFVQFFKTSVNYTPGKFLGRNEKYYLDIPITLNKNNVISLEEYFEVNNRYLKDIDIRNMKQKGEVFTIVEEMPEYPGGISEMFQFLGQHVKYPVEAKANGVSGRVYVNFVVRRTGLVSQVKIIRGVHHLLDEEALRVVKMFPLWKPGYQRGYPVNVSYNLPINFRFK